MDRAYRFLKFHAVFNVAQVAIDYNELVTDAAALQNVVDQTQAIHTLKSKGVSIRPTDLAFLSPCATSKLKRFGEYPTDLKPQVDADSDDSATMRFVRCGSFLHESYRRAGYVCRPSCARVRICAQGGAVGGSATGPVSHSKRGAA